MLDFSIWGRNRPDFQQLKSSHTVPRIVSPYMRDIETPTITVEYALSAMITIISHLNGAMLLPRSMPELGWKKASL